MVVNANYPSETKELSLNQRKTQERQSNSKWLEFDRAGGWRYNEMMSAMK